MFIHLILMDMLLMSDQIEQSKGEHADHAKAIEYYLKAHGIASSKSVY